VHMIKAVRDNATDPVAHAVLTRILKDESFHSRFGWWWLEAMPLDDLDRAYAKRYVARLLPSLATQLAPKPRKRPSTPNPFGSAGAEAREAAFADALHKTILPGFDRAGLEATAIWEHVQPA